jgi:medium-chain acyl-[acyl-carrier-protein] hydrolase
MADQKRDPKDAIHVENYIVRSYEIDSRGRVSIQSVCRYLGEIAGNHAAELGVSVEILLRKKLTWVLSRLHVRMQRYPFWREPVRIETWPSGKGKLYALRDFRIFSGKGEIIGTATTSWMIIDLARKRPASIPEFISKIPVPDVPRALDAPFEKLPELEKADFSKTFNVRLSDLDLNQHVNFVNYIEWAVEAVPAETWKDFKLEEIEISYRAESKYGDRIVSQVQQTRQEGRQTCLHRLHKEADKREVAVLRTGWIPL